MFTTSDEYCLLGAYIILVKSTLWEVFCLYNSTSIRVLFYICAMIQYKRVMVIFVPFDKFVQSVKMWKVVRCVLFLSLS